MDPLYAKAHGKVGGSTTTKSTKSKKKKRSARTQSAGQSSGRPQLGTGEPTSESGRSRSKRSTPDGSGESNSAAIMMNAMHVLDVGLGIAYIIGATMEPGTEATAALISLGAVLLLGSLCGAVGYFSKSCNRAGLFGSVIVGVVALVAYTGTFIWALVSWDSCVAFFDQDELFGMGDKKILTTVVLAAVAVFECIRIITASITRKQLLKKDAQTKSSGSTRSSSTTSSASTWCTFLGWCGIAKKKRSDDFVMFDDNASMESALLWSKDGGQPSSDDYLEFVPEHERGLANYTSNIAMPLPPEDKTDY